MFHSSQPANIAYFLVTMNGVTYNQTMVDNLSMNSILLSIIQQGNDGLLCPKQTKVLLLENSIQDFYAPCPMSHL